MRKEIQKEMRKETKKLPITIFAVVLSILLGIPSAMAVFYYTRPMEDASYDLSLAHYDSTYRYLTLQECLFGLLQSKTHVFFIVHRLCVLE